MPGGSLVRKPNGDPNDQPSGGSLVRKPNGDPNDQTNSGSDVAKHKNPKSRETKRSNRNGKEAIVDSTTSETTNTPTRPDDDYANLAMLTDSNEEPERPDELHDTLRSPGKA